VSQATTVPGRVVEADHLTPQADLLALLKLLRAFSSESKQSGRGLTAKWGEGFISKVGEQVGLISMLFFFFFFFFLL